MATPVEVKPTFTNIDMNSRTGANSPIDPVRVSAEAPAPDIVERLRNGEPCKEASGDNHCKVMDARSGCLCAIAADTITALTAENERLQSIITAADRGSPIYKAIEQRLDEMSAWIARPNDDVTQAVALTAGIAWSIHHPLEVVEQNLSLQLDNHRLTAEVERLRAALERLSNELRQFGYEESTLAALTQEPRT